MKNQQLRWPFKTEKQADLIEYAEERKDDNARQTDLESYLSDKDPDYKEKLLKDKLKKINSSPDKNSRLR